MWQSYVFALAPQEIADNVMKLDPRLWEFAKEEAKESALPDEDAKRHDMSGMKTSESATNILVA